MTDVTAPTPVLRPRAPVPRQEFVGGVSIQVRGVRSRDEGGPEEAGELRHRVAGLDGSQVQQVVRDLGVDVPVVVR